MGRIDPKTVEDYLMKIRQQYTATRVSRTSSISSIHPMGWVHHPLVSNAHLTIIFHASVCAFLFRTYNIVKPFLYIVQPFPFWSSSFCFPFHLPEHHFLYQSAIFHSTDVPKQVQFPFLDSLYDVSFAT